MLKRGKSAAGKYSSYHSRLPVLTTYGLGAEPAATPPVPVTVAPTVEPALKTQIDYLVKIREEVMEIMRVWNTHVAPNLGKGWFDYDVAPLKESGVNNVVVWLADTKKVVASFRATPSVPVTKDSASSCITAGKAIILNFKTSLAVNDPIKFCSVYGFGIVKTTLFTKNRLVGSQWKSDIVLLLKAMRAIAWKVVTAPVKAVAYAATVVGKTAVGVAEDVVGGVVKGGQATIDLLDFLRRNLKWIVIGGAALYVVGPMIGSAIGKKIAGGPKQ